MGVSSSFADSFTASNVQWNPTAHSLSFNTNIDVSGKGSISIVAGGGTLLGSSWNYSAANCNATFCSVDTSTWINYPYDDVTNFSNIEIEVGNDNTGTSYFSQDFTYNEIYSDSPPLPTPTPDAIIYSGSLNGFNFQGTEGGTDWYVHNPIIDPLGIGIVCFSADLQNTSNLLEFGLQANTWTSALQGTSVGIFPSSSGIQIRGVDVNLNPYFESENYVSYPLGNTAHEYGMCNTGPYQYDVYFDTNFVQTVNIATTKDFSGIPVPALIITQGNTTALTNFSVYRAIDPNHFHHNILPTATPTPTPIPNQPPLINQISNTTIGEGSTYTTSGSFTDPDSTSWTGTVDYGDGTGILPLPLNGDKTFTLSHQYNEEGQYTITVTIADNQGATGQTSAIVTVTDVNPTVSILSPSVNPIQINTPVTFSSTFTDPGTSDTYAASWNWGDTSPVQNGTVTQQSGSTPGTVIDSHTYANPGVYTVTLTITDGDGGSTTQIFQYLSVYNPTAQGIFSAGSKFSSPAGAYTANPNLTGNVLFGLSYKYQGSMPVGDRQFTMNFKAANLTFNATTVSSLVISNGTGTLSGTGTINGGSQVYTYLVTGNEPNNTIRVQITDPSNNNAVIYDTQPGDPAIAASTTSVSGKVLAH